MPQRLRRTSLGVWHCPALPPLKHQRAVDAVVSAHNTERLIIFTGDTEQQWRWPRYRTQRASANPRLVSHTHTIGEPDSSLADKLDLITIPPGSTVTVPELLARMRDAFDEESETASVAAARLMGELYSILEADKVPPDTASLLLARLLFLMFGDDTKMWDTNLFHDLVADHTSSDGSDLATTITDLFDVLDTAEDQRPAGTPGPLAVFPYVNGGLFDDEIELPHLSPDFRRALIDACRFDWGQISPAVFGSMFQTVKSKEDRRETGEHYTTEANILKTIEPLFLDDLRNRLQSAWDDKAALTRLHNHLKTLRYLDPACGCGNFLIVAYRELRDLELELLKRRRDLDLLDGRTTGPDRSQLSIDATIGLHVTLDQFHGIEIEPWPARIAETAMFLVDHQANMRMEQELGIAPRRLPIRIAPKIVNANALRTDWTDVVPHSSNVLVFGNPPFLGISLRSTEQTDDLKHVWGIRYHGTLDYVTGWYAKAMEYFGSAPGRWAFVSTSSVTQGEAVAPLFRPLLDRRWDIRFAHRTFRWTSEAARQAAVHCVIIGFGRDVRHSRLFDYATPDSQPVEVPSTEAITPYLTCGRPIVVDASTKPMNPQLGEVSYGNKPTDGGWLVVEPDERPEVEADPIAAKYLRPYVGARELIHDEPRYCLWLIEASQEDLRSSPVLQARVEHVRQFRQDSKAASTRAAAATPHLFRQIAQPNTQYLCIPAHVSEARPYFLAARFSPDVITSNANFLAADPDGLMFAVISSTMFITWQRTVGGRLESRLRFNKLLTWNTFPLPVLSPNQRRTIVEMGTSIQASRDRHAGRSLASLYAPGALPADLESAHRSLDQVVDEAFQLGRHPTVLQRQDALFRGYSDAIARRS